MDGLCRLYTWLSRHWRDGCPICNDTLNLLSFHDMASHTVFYSLTEKRVIRVAGWHRKRRRPRTRRFQRVVRKHRLARRSGGLSSSGIPRRSPIWGAGQNSWFAYCWRRMCREHSVEVFKRRIAVFCRSYSHVQCPSFQWTRHAIDRSGLDLMRNSRHSNRFLWRTFYEN